MSSLENSCTSSPSYKSESFCCSNVSSESIERKKKRNDRSKNNFKGSKSNEKTAKMDCGGDR